MSIGLHNRSAGRPVADPDRDTRALLLDAAANLFGEHGIAATSFALIARRAGLTPAMVHYHFRDRDRLLDALVDERLMPFIHAVWDPVRPDLNPAELIRGLVERLMQQIERSPWVPSTWMREILNDGGLLRERLFRRLPFDKPRLVGQAIAQGQAEHAVNPELDPLLFVFSTLGLVMLHMATVNVWSEVFRRTPLTSAAMQRHITGLLLTGLSPTWASRRKPSDKTLPLRRKP